MFFQKLEFSKINEVRVRSLKLLNDDIKIISNRAGWHHFVGDQKIGNVATAQGIIIHSYLNSSNSSLNKLFTTLREAQNQSENDLGGWSFITSTQDIPTIEATSWVLLGLVAGGEDSNSEIITKGKDWIINNQNNDGGWGSRKDLTSRVYTTFLACYCLSVIEPNLFKINDPIIRKAMLWILRCQNTDSGWGAAFGEKSSAIHTAFGLFALHIMEYGVKNEVEKGIQYLYSQWDTETMWEDTLKLEQYDLPTEGETFNRITFHYFPTAWIITTLFTIGESIFQEQLFSSVDWLIKSQNDDGNWSISNVPKNRFWSIHDGILAIKTFQDKAISSQGVDSMIMFDKFFILTKSHKSFVRLAKFTTLILLFLGALMGLIFSSIIEETWVKTNWAWLILGVYVTSIYPLKRFNFITLKEAIISLAIPALLLIIGKYLSISNT